jgi:hypothetical protein
MLRPPARHLSISLPWPAAPAPPPPCNWSQERNQEEPFRGRVREMPSPRSSPTFLWLHQCQSEPVTCDNFHIPRSQGLKQNTGSISSLSTVGCFQSTLSPFTGQSHPSRGQGQPPFPVDFHLPPPSSPLRHFALPSDVSPGHFPPPVLLARCGRARSSDQGPAVAASAPATPAPDPPSLSRPGLAPSPQQLKVSVTSQGRAGEGRGRGSGGGGGKRGAGGGGGALTLLPWTRPRGW